MEQMEHIRNAVERAKTVRSDVSQQQSQIDSAAEQSQFLPNTTVVNAARPWGSELVLNGVHLESNRIISHDIADPRSKSFDILRTQVLQSMEAKSWQLLGITSPTPGCGKSTIAANLALSIARLPDKKVLLVDLDMQKPQVSNALGLKCKQGVVSVLEGKAKLSGALVRAYIGKQSVLVLPCENSIPNSSEWMASRSMIALLQEIKRDFRGWTVILDLPPMLLSDDVITILPQIDCALFVATVGTSTVSEVKECARHLDSTPIVRAILNKSADSTASYYSRYGHY